MADIKKGANEPFLYDDQTDRITGLKNSDSTEKKFVWTEGNGTAAIQIPTGTIAQRPGTPAAGMMRHNTTSSRLEYYNGTAWQNFAVDALEVEYLVVAGGGGASSGGGGAGGYRTNFGGTKLALTVGTSYTVIVGAGGSADIVTSRGVSGNLSQFATITSAGGGGSGGASSNTRNGLAGGSGGGGGASSTSTSTGGNGDTPSVSPAQGTSGGGNAGFIFSPYSSGGGGGATSAGGNATSDSQSGNGGAGTANSISGSSVTYAGGGGGGVFSAGGTAGTGGAGGGGNGAVGTGTAVSGAANTGGGGGGSGSGGTAGAGGSGIVIIRYVGAPRCTGGTIDTTTVPGETIHEFKTSGTFALVA